MFIDTHAHVYSEYYDNINLVVNDSKTCGVKAIINAGVDHHTNQELLDLSNQYENMFITLGIHPEYANSYKTEELEFIQHNACNSKVVAIGEIGLDYHYDGYDKDKQIKLLKTQLDIAVKNNLPVVIHSREATQDTLDILKQYRLKGVIHSFSGSKEVANQYINMGYKLGINGVVTFKNAHIKEVIKDLGLEHFVLETDSPYLTPEPLRGKKNFPGNIKHIVNFLSDFLDITPEEISKITNANIKSIFDKFIY
ncbi:MAG: TatD family deoxyribonuclease [Firmicutes bacterium]|nr:TatD family deoxyribonuclease [Bacillota bacterium]